MHVDIMVYIQLNKAQISSIGCGVSASISRSQSFEHSTEESRVVSRLLISTFNHQTNLHLSDSRDPNIFIYFVFFVAADWNMFHTFLSFFVRGERIYIVSRL